MNADNVQRSDAEEKALQDLRKAELDLQRAEGEVSEAEHEIEEAHRDHDVTINVDGTDHQVHRGKWIVRQLKAAVGVDPAKVLAEITQLFNDGWRFPEAKREVARRRGASASTIQRICRKWGLTLEVLIADLRSRIS